MPKLTSHAKGSQKAKPAKATSKRKASAGSVPLKVVIVTLDSHLAGAADRARPSLAQDLPGLDLCLHVATEWNADPSALARCKADIETGDIIIACMLFMEDHIQAVLPTLQARRPECDAMVACISAGEIVRLTKLGQLDMSAKQSGPMALLKRLRGGRQKDGSPAGQKNASSGAKQMAMLRRLPKILRFIPGTAQDLRAYFLTMQYWLSGSDENIGNMVRFLADRYAAGPRESIRGSLKVPAPAEYPEVGVYHPSLPNRISDDLTHLPGFKGKGAQKAKKAVSGPAGTVGLLLMRSYVLGADAKHYDGVISALEAKGLRVIPAFAAGLDARPAAETFFLRDGKPIVDAVISLTGFSLVGGPAYNDAKAAEELLVSLDVPYLAAHAVEFQSLESWKNDSRGLMPMETTIMVAIPELDGATGPMVFGGRSSEDGMPDGTQIREMQADPERAEMLAARVAKWVELRKTAKVDRRIAITLFNFPPNSGATGTAAYLSVFASLHNTLTALKADGYTVDVPDDVESLRDQILNGNAQMLGADANVHTRIPADDHVRREPHLAEIEAQWGAAPGRHMTDGASLFVLGVQLGNVFVGVQPPFGYEGDPMRLLFEQGFAPTHAFSAYYRWIREDFGAHATLHFGTHGALEFMPGKQTGMTAACWPDRLIGDLPNVYLYAANNPSEGMLAKRRSAATLVSHLTPPVAHAGLYKGLSELKASLERWRMSPPEAVGERARIAELIQAQAAELDLAVAEPEWNGSTEKEITTLSARLIELENTLIPHGMHVVGETTAPQGRVDLLRSIADATHGIDLPQEMAAALTPGVESEAQSDGVDSDLDASVIEELGRTATLLAENHELDGLLRALDGRFIRPAPGGDLLKTTEILPTGRNIHGFDPFRIPSTFATQEGKRQAAQLLQRHLDEGAPVPETVAIVLWGTDNLKTEGAPIAQALALLGAEPRFDSYGRLCGAKLIPLAELVRPRIDILVTLSGIFRDLLPLQTKMLAEAAFLAATADEPEEMNFVRKHALAYQDAHGCDMETASLRVFSNADGAYGANVNQLVDSGSWDDEDELAEAYTRRKCFAYGCDGKAKAQPDVLNAVLSKVDLAFQNVDSIELGVTTIDHYFDTLGGVGRAVRRAKGEAAPVYIGDQTRGDGKVRTLTEQVALETRTRLLNPKWYEGMLEHGYEGVRQIEAHVTNTMGWSATTGGVDPWVYQRLTETYVLDEEMRQRVAALNPKAAMRVADRLLEAHERQYWQPDAETLDALKRAGEDLEDRLEGALAGAAD